MPNSNLRRVFLCHSSGDKDAVRKLYHRLLADGLNPWLDERDILPGQDWEREIAKAVRSSAVVLVCLSRNAANKTGYIQKEIRYALDVAAEQPEGTIFMIPVRLEECDVPDRLRQWQWVNLFDENGYGFILKALAAKGLGAGALTSWDLGTSGRVGTTSYDRRAPVSGVTDAATVLSEPEVIAEFRVLASHSSSVEAVVVVPNGRLAVSAFYDHTLKVWEVASGREVRTLNGHTGAVLAVAVTPDGKLATSASKDQTLKVWDIDSGRELRTLRGHSDAVSAVAVTPDGRLAISASWDKTLKVWDLDSGRDLRTFIGHSNHVTAVAVTRDMNLAISGSNDETLKVWDFASGRELRTLSGHTNWVRDVALTPDGQMAVSASYDQTLKIWQLNSKTELRTLRGHSNDVNAVALTPDGKLAVSGSDDNMLMVWEFASGMEVARVTGRGRLYCCTVSPDGETILAGDQDGRIYLLRLEQPRTKTALGSQD
jgi:WD40 repeat protein